MQLVHQITQTNRQHSSTSLLLLCWHSSSILLLQATVQAPFTQPLSAGKVDMRTQRMLYRAPPIGSRKLPSRQTVNQTTPNSLCVGGLHFNMVMGGGQCWQICQVTSHALPAFRSGSAWLVTGWNPRCASSAKQTAAGCARAHSCNQHHAESPATCCRCCYAQTARYSMPPPVS